MRWRRPLRIPDFGPNDVLIIEVAETLDPEQAAAIRAHYDRAGIRAVVQDKRLKIAAIKRAAR